MSQTALILGAGVGGLTVAERLRELLPDRDRVVLVDRSLTGVQGLSLLWVMRGWRTLPEVRFTPVIRQRGVEVIESEVQSILPNERRVETSDGEIRYDALVIALGASVDPSLLPGLSEAVTDGNAGEFYTPEGAERLYPRLCEVVAGRVCVVVTRVPFKCPAAPYEGAMLIADLLEERGVRDAVDVEVITPEPQPMPVAGPVVGQALTQIMQDQRISLRRETTVEQVDPSADELVLQTGERVHFDLLVAVPPHRPPAPLTDAGLGPAGWVPVDPRTLRSAADGVWALGDASAITLPNGRPLPKAAVFARGEADAVAAGVARHLGADAPDPWFDGHGYCYLEVGAAKAAKGAGSFLESPAPAVELHEPSTEFHEEKEEEERDWIRAWTG